jgi:GAF domain-containing protein
LTTEELIEQIAGLASLLIDEVTVDGALHRVADMAVAVIPTCDAATVSVVTSGAVATQAATSALAERLDEIQYRDGEGPGLQAIATGASCRIDAMAGETRWPKFVPEAAGQGLVGVLSLPLVAGNDVVGALNLYSCSGRFSEEDERLGALFAAQGAIGMTNVQTYLDARRTVDQLRQAVASRDIIGQAKGILMTREECTAEEAFDMLRRASQRLNQKLRDVAEQIVESAQKHQSPRRTTSPSRDTP